MTIEEMRRRLDEHHQRLRQQDDYNKRMDLRQEFFAESTESLNAQLSELGAKVDRMAEKVDSLSDLWGEISRLVLQHNGRIERLEGKNQ
jgi:predicted nuclease with TOPRIM domain